MIDEHTNTLRATELVRAQREQVDVGRYRSQVEPTHRLDRIGVEQRTWRMPTDNAADRFEIVDRTDFIVHGHHTDDRDRVTGPDNLVQGSSELLEIDTTGVIDTNNDSPVMLNHFENRVMLRSWAHRDAARSGDCPSDCHIVALGSTTGKHDVVRTAAEDSCDTVT
jgi:hypothetical protein